ncbi:hypothetical protein [Sinomonas sp. ASV322]|uniref:hypothetical protein n=1 Tax=Sinomonas sp. ASV322 TaxID=3041920 RepID=UPI0027DB1BFD|nr:hypothetical protein [Sinomonas sp. ASV322]MDQ4504096.1 hypothetical protein [Sinomonas sp. ASV322]
METERVHSSAELVREDKIEARRQGVVHFAGHVHEVMPKLDLFWATSDLGERRIIEFSEYSIHRHLLQ